MASEKSCSVVFTNAVYCVITLRAVSEVCFFRLKNESCRVLAERLLSQGYEVAFSCLDCFELEVARQMINELEIAGKQQGEHIKILIVKTPT